MEKRDADVKKMADLLRAGATMLSETCPDCKVPIFKLTTGETLCPACGRKVIFVKSSEAEKVVADNAAATALETVMLKKIAGIKEKMEKAEEPREIEKLSKTLASLFDTLEKVRRTKA
jgi:UPF0148 protein